MPAASKSTAPDAIELLKADHESVKALFEQFEKLKDQDDTDDQKAELVQRICAELTVHASIEEEIFYPALRGSIDDEELIDEAEVEHASAKDLIAQLQAASPGDDQYDAKVKVLGELIDHHVEEEEEDMFPEARKAIDVQAVGGELARRKAELSEQMGDAMIAKASAGKKSGPTRASSTR